MSYYIISCFVISDYIILYLYHIVLPLSVYLLTQGIPSVIYIISNTQNEIPDIHLQSVTARVSKSKKKIKKNWTRPEKFDLCFCVTFNRYCQKLIFEGEARHYPVFPTHSESLFLFPNFLRS